MQEKGIGPVADRDAATDEAIMGLLVEDRGIWSTDEMQRVIGDEIAATDSLARLRRGGLVHQCGDFVFASRTALEAADIWGSLCARHPYSATILCSSVLGLDSLVAHGFYDTYCLWDWREGND